MFLNGPIALAAPRSTADFPEPYKIPTPNPGSIEEIRDVTGAPGAPSGEIYQDLNERAVCGGMLPSVSAIDKIPIVAGVPGRKGFPFNKMPSGMAERDETSGALNDGFIFPFNARARGWSTACRAGFPPFFDEDPPCQQVSSDPNKDKMATPARCTQICQRMNKWQFPIWLAVWVREAIPPAITGDIHFCVQHGNKEKERNDNPTDGDCCERLGAFDREDTDPRDKAPSCAKKYSGGSPEDVTARWDPYPGKMPPGAECYNSPGPGFVLSTIIFYGWYYCCSGAIVSRLDYETCTLGSTATCASHPDARRNCVLCRGDGLPVGLAPGAEAPCLADAECTAPLVCKNAVPEQVFTTPCRIGHPEDCNVIIRGGCENGTDDDGDGLVDGSDPECTNPCCSEGSATCPTNCREWTCNADSQCAHPAIPGQCRASNGTVATIDHNGELIPRPYRMETGCRGGYGARIESGKMVPGQYISYFREYPRSDYRRSRVSGVPRDINTRINIPVACFGFYDEFDPKIRTTSVRDQRCVIGAYMPGNEFRTFYESQRGKGSFGQTSFPLDPNPTAPREIRNRLFNVSQDLWYPNLGGAFSLLNGEVFKREYGQDLTFALLSLDDALQRARGPILMLRSSSAASSASSSGFASSTHGPDPFVSIRSIGGLRRAFDDTVTNENGNKRELTETWQRVQTEVQQLLSPPVVHIIFPSAVSANLGLQETLFHVKPPEPPKPPAKQWSHEPERKTIEVQIEAGDDVIGDVAALLESALIAPAREYPLPLVVPFGSATDFRAYKEGWVRWKTLREHYGLTVDPAANDLIDRLEEYAVGIDAARELRAQLPAVLGKMLLQQNTLRAVIHDWLQAHRSAFLGFQEQRNTVEELRKEWQGVQEENRKFHDTVNMPWCKNDTFTTPVYSFLDPWYGRPTTGQTPIPVTDRPEDLFIDLTTFEVSTDTILVPVLKPVQLLIEHEKLQPPGAFQESITIPDLPALPALPTLSISGALALPVKTEEGMTITYPTFGIEFQAAEELISAALGTIKGMAYAYGKFWDAITKPRCGTPEAAVRCRDDDPTKGDCCVIAGEEEYCRRGYGKDTCVHVEMDLVERFTRMGARPAVQLWEDFQVAGSWRSAGRGSFLPCDPEDWSCMELHEQQHKPRIGWFSKVRVADQTSSLDSSRLQLFRDTLESAGASSAFPYEATPETITPSFDQRPDIILSPAHGSSSLLAP